MNYPFKSFFNSSKTQLPKTVDDGFFWQMPSGNALNWNNNNFLKDYSYVLKNNARGQQQPGVGNWPNTRPSS